DFIGAKKQPIKTKEAVRNSDVSYRYRFNQDNFKKIPGSPLAYWASEKLVQAFTGKNIKDFGIARSGLSTGNNNKYMRLGFEINIENIGFNYSNNNDFLKYARDYVPINKGGKFRKWYGNNEYVINWDKADEFHRPRTTYTDLYFKPGITWSAITSGDFSSRFYEKGFLFDHAAASLFINNKDYVKYYIGLMRTNVFNDMIKMLNPTLNSGAETIEKIPVIISNTQKSTIDKITNDSINLSKFDWNTFEVSWHFKKNPLVDLGAYKRAFLFISHEKNITLTSNVNTRQISEVYEGYKYFTNRQFNQLKENEEELNRIFIDIYS